MINSFFENFFAPQLPGSIGGWILAILLGVALTGLARFLLAWFIVTLRGFKGNGLWNGEEIIYDTKVWADLVATLLWALVIGYCIVYVTYQHIYALAPYGVALVTGFVLSILSIRKLSNAVDPYRRAVRQ